MEIKVLGTGCPKCKALDAAVREIVAEQGLDAKVEKVEDIMDILQYGIISTPALVIDGEVKLSGYVPGHDELRKILITK
jgi:small redox-active disulfide protein 2